MANKVLSEGETKEDLLLKIQALEAKIYFLEKAEEVIDERERKRFKSVLNCEDDPEKPPEVQQKGGKRKKK